MLTVHALQFGLNADSIWIWGVAFSLFDFLGAPGFVFAAGISLSLSVRRKAHRYHASSLYDHRIQRDVWFSSLLLLAIGFAFNLVGRYAQDGIAGIWAWYVLQTIAVLRLVAYYLLKLPRGYRVALAFGVVAATPIVLDFFYGYQAISEVGGVLWHALFHPSFENPPFPFLAYILVGTVVGGALFRQQSQSPALLPLFRRQYVLQMSCTLPAGRHVHTPHEPLHGIAVKAGVILVLASVWLGGLQLTTFDLGFRMISILNTNPWGDVAGVPLFLARNSYASVVFNLGCQLALFGWLHYRAGQKRGPKLRRPSSPASQASRGRRARTRRPLLSELGSLSLTIYLYHHLFVFLFTNQFTTLTIWPAWAGVLILNALLARIWTRKARGRGSVEWAISKLRRLLFTNLGA